MKNLLVLVFVVAFGAVLAIVIGNHLSNEAMAVVVGAVCGITASIPISLALIIASSQNWGRNAPRQGYDQSAQRYAPQGGTPQPPQVIVHAAGPARFAPGHTPLLPPGVPAADAPRQFRIIGDENPDW